MESLYELIHQLKELLNPKNIIDFLTTKGLLLTYFGLIFIVFAETGLAVGFFLPGDSLLVVAGLVARIPPDRLNVVILLGPPIVAGAAQMSYRQFLAFNVVGGFAWVFSMILAGYFLGTVVERAFGIKLEDHIEKVVVVVVFLSLLPPVFEYIKSRREKARKLREGTGDVSV